MQVQVSTDNHIEGGEELSRQVEAVVEDALGRFSDWITRVEVQLSDESSSSKARDNDKRCVMEARPANLQPIIVSHQGATLDQALKGCAKKLSRILNDTAGRLGDPKGRTSYAGDQTSQEDLKE
ncbi:MAG TPA: HPF/RaiA family ribosome-associated protein [Pirellulaceae bacterium]|nr:HPF/RaiA family ribosome-associated protein [Pirellulaceae bacterium]